MTRMWLVRHTWRAFCYQSGVQSEWKWPVRRYSTRGLDSSAIADLLSKPTWSVEALHNEQATGKDTPSITRQQLHHLLKLSALPLPKDDAEESEMIKMLEAQLGFVQAVQGVDTTGVEPLQSLRDETAAAGQENEITVESLKKDIARESAVGFSRRIVRRKDPGMEHDPQQYDPTRQAPKTLGPYVVVNTKDSKPME